MMCPVCNSENIGCVDSRPMEGHRRRRYKCLNCNRRWNTVEITEEEYKVLRATPVPEYKVLKAIHTKLGQLIANQDRIKSKKNDIEGRA